MSPVAAPVPGVRRPALRRLRWVVRVVSWLVTVVVTGIVLAAVVVPRVAGATPYTVLTGSMAPAYPPGTLVVVRPAEAEDLAIGDVVTYQLESGRPTTVTHRIVAVGWNGQGEKVLITQGDANGAPDVAPVRPVQVRGELWYAVPWVGHLSVLLSPAQHELLVQLAAGGLFLYAGSVVVQGYRTRPHPPRSSRHRDGVTA